MEITIEKENGEPMSEKEAADLLRFIRHQLKPLIEIEEEDCPFEPEDYSHDMEIFLQEDDSYVYAAALCPGISKDRLEVVIDGLDLIIRSKPADPDAENDDDSRRFPWKFFEDLSYAKGRSCISFALPVSHKPISFNGWIVDMPVLIL